MEPALEQRTPTDDDLLSAAAYYARDVQALCMDVSAMAFPSGHHAPTEEKSSRRMPSVKKGSHFVGIYS
jgi:hypothetical protein